RRKLRGCQHSESLRATFARSLAVVRVAMDTGGVAIGREAEQSMRPFILAICWYVVPGIIWVLASDSLVALVGGDPAILPSGSAVKGVVFVLVSGLIIYRLLARQQAARRVVEAVYTESERGFRSLFKNTPLPVWAYDCETLRFLEINDVALAKY